jgi:hypothetical protein
MREPTREEMIEGIAKGTQRFFEQHYSATYRRVDTDFKDGVERAAHKVMKEKK